MFTEKQTSTKLIPEKEETKEAEKLTGKLTSTTPLCLTAGVLNPPWLPYTKSTIAASIPRSPIDLTSAHLLVQLSIHDRLVFYQHGSIPSPYSEKEVQ